MANAIGRTLAKGQRVTYTFYGQSATATIERVANGIVWLDNGRWMHAESVTPVNAIGRTRRAKLHKADSGLGFAAGSKSMFACWVFGGAR